MKCVCDRKFSSKNALIVHVNRVRRKDVLHEKFYQDERNRILLQFENDSVMLYQIHQKSILFGEDKTREIFRVVFGPLKYREKVSRSYRLATKDHLERKPTLLACQKGGKSKRGKKVKNVSKMSASQRVAQNQRGVSEKKARSYQKTVESRNSTEKLRISKICSVCQKISKSRREVRENMSRGSAKAYAEGRIRTKGNSVTGYYRETHYFRSWLEYRTMKALDILERKWTEKHGITIPWYNAKEKRMSNYSPDFLIDDNKIWETKGFVDEEKTVFLKAEVAQKFVKESGGTYQKYSLLFDKQVEELEKRATKKLSWTYEQYYSQVAKERFYYALKRDKRKAYLVRKKEEKRIRTLQLLRLEDALNQIVTSRLRQEAA